VGTGFRARSCVDKESGVRQFRPRGFLKALIIAPVLAFAGAAQAACPPDSRIEDWVLAKERCLALSTFGAEAAGTAPVLVIVVHGDISDGGSATYHAAFAREIAGPGIVAVALTRPGYRNETGRLSEGSTHGRVDNYTADNIGTVARAIAALSRHYRPRLVIYVGHSGGAAIGGVIAARYPRLVDVAVLVSCPCDIARWRQERWRDTWQHSESPSRHLSYMQNSTRVIAITGTADTNTFPALAEDYVARLTGRGIDARFLAVEGAGHGFSGLAAATAKVVADLARP
jgi:dienelactone hydrolase